MSLRTDRIISGKDRLENEPHFPPPAGGDDEVQEYIYIICRDCAGWKEGFNRVFGHCKKKQVIMKYSDTCTDWKSK